MADLKRKATAVWQGDLRGGKGAMTSSSGAFTDLAFSFTTRFENEPGTNPEELIAAAHAGCYSMALSARLSREGYTVQSIETEATCTLSSKPEGGFKIAKMNLKARGKVDGLDAAKFQEIAKEVEASGCPVSVMLHTGIPVELDAALA